MRIRGRLLRRIELQAQHRTVDALDALEGLVHRIELLLHLAEGLDHLVALRRRIRQDSWILLLGIFPHADALPEPEGSGCSSDEKGGGDQAAVVAVGLHVLSVTDE